MRTQLVSRLALAASLLILPLSAQDFQASIGGVVTDPVGAPVAGVQVRVTNLERRINYDSTSNESGLYLIRFLPPGTYDVSAEKSGFKRFVREGIRLAAVDRLDLGIRLELGAVSESVTVTGEVAALETESASRTATIERKFVEDIPVSGRNLFQFQYTLPGVTKASRYWGSFELYAFGNINGVTINGGRVGENEVLLDGQTTTRGSRSASFAPALNAIEEVTIRTNSYDAAYGRIGGGVTSITLKTGTNQLHGQLYEFLKNDNLNSNGYSANAAGVRRPEFKNNTFGFTVDGPVYIPKLIDGRNRLFFMISTEFLRERNPQIQLWTVPTLEERRGDFTGLLDNQGRQITIYDPLTTVGTTRTPFAGNRIPQARINAVGANAAGFYPNPNRQSESLDGANNYLFVNSSRNQYDQWLGKMDFNVTQTHRLSWRYGETPWYNWARVQWGTNAAEPSGEFPSTRISRNWGAEWTWTMSPSVVLNLRAGLARYEGFSGNTFAAGFDPRQLGFPDTLVRQFTALQFPRFNLNDKNFSPLGATRTQNYETQDTWSLAPVLNMIRGRHSLKFGTDLRRYHDNRLQPESASGVYNFTRVWTQADPQRGDALSGNVFASFLLGYPASGSVPNNIDPSWRNYYYGLYVQDDWKITTKLTLNLGLRWDYETPITERYNRQVRGFAFDQPSPIASQVQGLTLRGGLVYAGSSGRERLAFNPDRNNFQPRVGVAWQFKEGWVMRGGYGLTMMGQNASGPATGFSQTTSLVASTDNNLTPAVTLSDPFPARLFPTGLLRPIGSSQGLATNLGLGVGAQFLDRPLPYSHQFSFGFQKALANKWLVDTSYVGNLTRKLPVSTNLNFIPTQELNRLPVAERPAYFNAQVTNPMRGLLPGSAFNGATVPRQQLLFAYPHFSNVSISNLPIGGQSYHSLQMKGTRRYSNGIATQFSYTWAKMLERVSQLNAQDTDLGNLLNTGLEQRLAEWDIPHTFSATVAYELPFGKNKRFFGNMNSFADAFFGGWNVNILHMRRSGTPVEFPNAAPIVARSAKLTASQRDELARAAGRDKFNPFFDKWFDTSVFPRTAQAAFTLRDFPTRFPDVRHDGLQSWEISVYKEFRIRERVRTQIRADFQNAFDYAHFGRLVTRPNNVQDTRFGQLDPAQGNQPRIVVLVAKIIF
jgi:hypothetical protein